MILEAMELFFSSIPNRSRRAGLIMKSLYITKACMQVTGANTIFLRSPEGTLVNYVTYLSCPDAAGPANSFGKPLQKSLPIIIVTKDGTSFNSTRHDMINQSGNIQSRLSRHIAYL
ncbi:MAG: hypothetical protein P8X63_08850, partial [Desulfuromonadaceae bacterium]